MTALVYRPWVPQAGMAGTYRHLVTAWGSPNAAQHDWPQGVLERVCERGEAIPVVADQDVWTSRVYAIDPAKWADYLRPTPTEDAR
jgi:hypothetical protein